MSDYLDDQNRFFDELLILVQERNAARREQELKRITERTGWTRAMLRDKREKLVAVFSERKRISHAEAEALADDLYFANTEAAKARHRRRTCSA